MQDRGDYVAVDATILTVGPVTLSSDTPDSTLLAHGVPTIAVVVNECSLFSK